MQLNFIALNIRFEYAQLEEIVTLSLDKLSLEQLYNLQRKIQQELQDWEEIVHDEVLLVNQEKERYVEECATLHREKEEVK